MGKKQLEKVLEFCTCSGPNFVIPLLVYLLVHEGLERYIAKFNGLVIGYQRLM